MKDWTNKAIEETPPFISLLAARQVAEEIFFEDRNLTAEGYFEAVAFSYSYIIEFVRNSRLELKGAFEEDCTRLLYLFMRQLNIENKSPVKPVSFIFSRIRFYIREIEEMKYLDGKTSSKIYNLFYVDPLVENPYPNSNLSELLIFSIKMKKAFMFLNKVESILSEDDNNRSNSLLDRFIGDYTGEWGQKVVEISMYREEGSKLGIKFQEIFESMDGVRFEDKDLFDTDAYVDSKNILRFVGQEVDYDGTPMELRFEFRFIDGGERLEMKRVFHGGVRELYGVFDRK